MMLITRILFWGYTLFLAVLGTSGMLSAPWELRTIFVLPLDALPDIAEANLLNQYRFLKAVEMAFGIFCIVWRKEIFCVSRANQLFVAAVFFGVAARLGSWAIDGTPHTMFLIFTLLELMTGVMVAWAVYRTTPTMESKK